MKITVFSRYYCRVLFTGLFSRGGGVELHVYFILYNIRYVRTFYIHDGAETHGRGGGARGAKPSNFKLRSFNF